MSYGGHSGKGRKGKLNQAKGQAFCVSRCIKASDTEFYASNLLRLRYYSVLLAST